MTDRYAVFGNPVNHSQSPWIHTRFAEQTGQDLEYSRVEVPLDGFAAAVQRFFQQGGRGLNITVPFKQEAWALCQQRSARAETAGAVNTLLLREDGALFGDNTDGIGLLRDLRNTLGLEPAGKRLLVLGAGGAVRGVLEPLLDTGPTTLVIANRTVAKAEALAEAFGPPVIACGFDALADQQFDLLINATSSGLQGEMPRLPDGLMAPGAAAYDMVYGPEPTPFIRWAEQQGASRVCDGLGMLVEQAAESFRLWRGMAPETGAVIRDLRARLQA